MQTCTRHHHHWLLAAQSRRTQGSLSGAQRSTVAVFGTSPQPISVHNCAAQVYAAARRAALSWAPRQSALSAHESRRQCCCQAGGRGPCRIHVLSPPATGPPRRALTAPRTLPESPCTPTHEACLANSACPSAKCWSSFLLQT